MTNLPSEEKKGSLISRSKGLLDSAVSGLKGRDLNALVDEFTQEMTVVAEGFSEDLSMTRQEVSQLSASQTIHEEKLQQNLYEIQSHFKDIDKRLDALAKMMDKQTKKNGTLSSVLTQVTIIAAIIAGAWVVTAVLTLFGR